MTNYNHTMVTHNFITALTYLSDFVFSLLWLLFKSLIFYLFSNDGKKVDFNYMNLRTLKYKVSQTWKLMTNISKWLDSNFYSDPSFHLLHLTFVSQRHRPEQNEVLRRTVKKWEWVLGSQYCRWWIRRKVWAVSGFGRDSGSKQLSTVGCDSVWGQGVAVKGRREILRNPWEKSISWTVLTNGKVLGMILLYTADSQAISLIFKWQMTYYLLSKVYTS